LKGVNKMEEKRNNKGYIIVIILLFILVVLLGGYIGYDKLMNNNERPTNLEEETSNNEFTTAPVKGECPLKKFDGSYVLTDADKEEIMQSLETLNAGFTREVVDLNSMKIISGDNGTSYVHTVQFTSLINGDKLVASIMIVNDKFKVETAGSGFDIEVEKYKSHLINRICS